jgi:hypothetical protein
MTQLSFSDAEHAGKRKQTRREVFLAEMEQVVPWKALLALIEPHYPKAGRGRHPYAMQTMLRIHLLQQNRRAGLDPPCTAEGIPLWHLFDAEDFLPYVERILHERRRAWIE